MTNHPERRAIDQPYREGRRHTDPKSVDTKVDEVYRWHLTARDQLSKLEERVSWIRWLVGVSVLLNGYDKLGPLIAKAWGGH